MPDEFDFNQAAISSETTSINQALQSGNPVLAKLFFTQENRVGIMSGGFLNNIFTDI